MTPARIRKIIPFTLVHFHFDYLKFELLHVSVSRRKSSVNFSLQLIPEG
ncbi:hypothetical protein AVDCRST_MAG84-1345 [uncultured Microcoleus sp.]|uniref:Uncharacterized protein n=1 Tax=uncultured Microcoleus sp. TaxID=259945 RepID=A0A6J4L369_9CYAN|nr:hypothetical protein AVDCRST_MAG84-1345 [uncultured Microcoleus sp.]